MRSALTSCTLVGNDKGNTLDTFKAEEQGYLGGFLSFEPFFYYPASKPTFKHTFNISAVEVMPQVDILYGLVPCFFFLVGRWIRST